jgi:hypothetical protein
MQVCSLESGADLVVGKEQEYAVEVVMQSMEWEGSRKGSHNHE